MPPRRVTTQRHGASVASKEAHRSRNTPQKEAMVKRKRKSLRHNDSKNETKADGPVASIQPIRDVFRLSIPHALPSWNVLYSGKHWNVRKEMAHVWKLHTIAAVQYAALTNGGRVYYGETPVNIFVRVLHKSKRRRDSDNVCAKLVIDGLKVAGVIADDDPRYVCVVSTEAVQSDRDETQITITPTC